MCDEQDSLRRIHEGVSTEDATPPSVTGFYHIVGDPCTGAGAGANGADDAGAGGDGAGQRNVGGQLPSGQLASGPSSFRPVNSVFADGAFDEHGALLQTGSGAKSLVVPSVSLGLGIGKDIHGVRIG